MNAISQSSTLKTDRKDEVHLQKNKSYPLKGLVLCINCEHPMYASAPKTGSGSYSPRYHCARTSCRGKVKSVKAVTVHQDFEELLARIKPSEGILRLYKQILIREASNTLGSLNKKLNAVRGSLSEIDELKLKTVRKYADESLTLDEKNALTDSLEHERLEKSEELRELEKQQTIRETDIELAINLMGSVDKQWSESVFDVQLRFQSMLFPEGLVYDSINHRFGTSQISPLYRCLPNKKDLPDTEKSFLVAGPGLEPGTSWL